MERSLEGLSCRVLASIGPALISAGNSTSAHGWAPKLPLQLGRR